MSAVGPTACAAIVVAAGRGERFGAEVPKALIEVGGRPLVVHAVDRLHRAGLAPIVVVHAAEHRAAFVVALDGLPAGAEVRLVPGGDTRTASVRAGLAAVPAEVPRVAVHDAARGLQPTAVIAAAVAALTGEVVAAAPGIPVDDTIKRIDGGTVVGTVDRDELLAVQTPQVVERGILEAVHATSGSPSDDLGLVETWLAGGGAGRIVCVAGSPLGRKVTRPQDVTILEALLG